MEQISAELNARAATARKLQAEARDAEALNQLTKEQAEAVGRLVHAEVDGSERRIRRDSVLIGLLWFIAGVAATIGVTLLVHPLH